MQFMKGYVQRCSEDGNEYQGSITRHKFLDKLGDY